MITIGAVYSGPELEGGAFNKLISSVAKVATKVCGPSETFVGPAVNVIFCVAGSLGKPDWDHGRITKYSPKRKLLLVQVAVPPEVVSSRSALDFVILELHGANALAFEFYRQKHMQYPLAEAEERVRQIRGATEEGPKPVSGTEFTQAES